MTDHLLHADVKKLAGKRRRDVAFGLIEALRRAQEETGYGGVDDCLAWARRIAENREY